MRFESICEDILTENPENLFWVPGAVTFYIVSGSEIESLPESVKDYWLRGAGVGSSSQWAEEAREVAKKYRFYLDDEAKALKYPVLFQMKSPKDFEARRPRLMAVDNDGGKREFKVRFAQSMKTGSELNMPATHWSLHAIMCNTLVDPFTNLRSPVMAGKASASDNLRFFGVAGRYTRDSFATWKPIGDDSVRRWLDALERSRTTKFADRVRVHEADSPETSLDDSENTWYWVERNKSKRFTS